jgi:hypothetical protein
MVARAERRGCWFLNDVARASVLQVAEKRSLLPLNLDFVGSWSLAQAMRSLRFITSLRFVCNAVCSRPLASLERSKSSGSVLDCCCSTNSLYTQYTKSELRLRRPFFPLDTSSPHIRFLTAHGSRRLHAEEYLVFDVFWHRLVIMEESLCRYHRLPSCALTRLLLGRINLYRPDLAQHSVHQRTCCSR